MIDGQHPSNLSNFLIRLLSSYEIIRSKHHTGEIPQPLPPYTHSRPEPGIQSRCDPRRSKIRSCVEICEGFRAFETQKLPQISCDVEVEEGYNEGLPGCDEFGETSRKLSDVGRAMLIPSIKRLEKCWSDLGLEIYLKR
jgi:hypothetical protein